MAILGGLWAVGLLVLAVQWVADDEGKAEGKRIKPEDPADALRSVLEYVNHTVPVVFSDRGHWTERMWQEIVDHHMLFMMFKRRRQHERLKVVSRTLTQMTFMLFLVAVFFDVSVPSNDSSCETHKTEEDCLRRVSPFDYTQTYCQWENDTTCFYEEQKISFTAMFYLSILTTIITSITTLPIDYMFTTLNAPTASSLKGSKVAAAATTVVNGMRRLSNVGAGIVASLPIRTPSIVETSARYSLKRLSILSAVLNTEESVMGNREIPAEVFQLGDLARQSMSTLKTRASRRIARWEETGRRLKSDLVRRSMSLTANSKILGKNYVRETESVDSSPLHHINNTILLQDVMQQRLLMNDDAKETVIYDAQWGVCKSDNHSGMMNYTINPATASAIANVVKLSLIHI